MTKPLHTRKNRQGEGWDVVDAKGVVVSSGHDTETDAQQWIDDHG
jgi:hypothetical protein